MATQFDTGIFSVIDNASALLVDAKLYWYVGGTTTPVNTFTTSALDVENSNPVEADADGRFPAIWLAPGTYKYILTDATSSPESPIVTRDGYIADSAPPSFDPGLDDFLAGDEPLPIANGGTASTSAVDALANLGAVPVAGAVALTGQIGQSTKGAYLYNAVGGLVGGAVYVTADDAADPRDGNNQFWFKYPA